MNIRFGIKNDYIQLAELKWLHMEEDDIDYNETNLVGVDSIGFIEEYVSFLEKDSYYQIFVAEENGLILSVMFLCMIPKIPKPNREAKSIAYLTSVYTRKEYRNKEIGAKLLKFIKNFALKQGCELIFAWPSNKSAAWYEKNGFLNENEIYECGLLVE